MVAYRIPARRTRAAIEISRSRFIATAAPAFTVEEARAFIDEIRAEFADASHHVPAFLIGHDARVIAHCSDAGEPSGTAGRPMLAVLQGSGLGDIVVVVTRYFGGTKLGTGGLVRAYGDAVRAVLDALPLAHKVATHTVAIAVPYSFYERAQRLIAAHQGLVLDEEFAVEVTLTARFAVDGYRAFVAALSEQSNGTIEPLLLDSDKATIMPINDDPGI
jgi:uncharacterized YigZ family protein